MIPKTSKDNFNSVLASDFVAVRKPKKGKNYYRLIAGPKAIKEVWYPYLGVDSETGMPKTRFKQIQVPNSGSEILNILAGFDKRLVMEWESDEEKAQKYKSAFSPNRKTIFLGFDRSDSELQIVPIDLPYSVVKRLNQIQQELSNKNPQYLKYGMLYMYDVIINKEVDDKKPVLYGTSYTADVDIEDMHSVKIPRGILDGDISFEDIEGGLENFFTEEEIQVLEETSDDLDEMFIPMTEEEIAKTLVENPPLLTAERDDKPVFAGLSNLMEDEEVYEEFLEAIPANFQKALLKSFDKEAEEIEEVKEEPKQKQLPGIDKKRKITEAEVVEEVEEAEEAEEVEEEMPKAKPKARSKAKPKAESKDPLKNRTRRRVF